jgi:hypothetical protein
MELLSPRPHGSTFAVYASAVWPHQGLRAVHSAASLLPQGDGSASDAVLLKFRVTATTLGIDGDSEPPASFDTNLKTEDLLKSLHFRLRVNLGGLDSERLQPAEVRLIGVPADVPYGERIYRVVFRLPVSSNGERAVLEVLAADGELLCKFPIARN